MNIFLSLRSCESVLLDFATIESLLTLPSLHTVLAVLAAFALWPIPYVRWLAAVVALFLIITTMTTGWHYGVDVIAGLVLTLVSCRLGMALLGLDNPPAS